MFYPNNWIAIFFLIFLTGCATTSIEDLSEEPFVLEKKYYVGNIGDSSDTSDKLSYGDGQLFESREEHLGWCLDEDYRDARQREMALSMITEHPKYSPKDGTALFTSREEALEFELQMTLIMKIETDLKDGLCATRYLIR